MCPFGQQQRVLAEASARFASELPTWHRSPPGVEVLETSAPVPLASAPLLDLVIMWSPPRTRLEAKTKVSTLSGIASAPGAARPCTPPAPRTPSQPLRRSTSPPVWPPWDSPRSPSCRRPRHPSPLALAPLVAATRVQAPPTFGTPLWLPPETPRRERKWVEGKRKKAQGKRNSAPKEKSRKKKNFQIT